MQTIKSRLISANLLFTVSLLLLAGYLAIGIYLPKYEHANGLIEVDELSNLIITAAGQQAIERGVTNGALSQARLTGSANAELLNNIRKRRQAGDAAMQQALNKARLLAEESWIPAGFRSSLSKSENAWQRFQSARQQADLVMNSGRGSLTNQQWVSTATAMIIANAELRQAAFLPTANADKATYYNQVIKQAAWQAAEYAGRERALLAASIGSGKPLPTATHQTLLGYRAIVENQLQVLQSYAQRLNSNEDINRTYINAWQQAEQQFMGSYQQLREQIYNASESGSYPIPVSSWIQRSTQAINTLLSVGDAASQSAIAVAQQEAEANQTALTLSAVLVIAVIALAISLGILILRMVSRLRAMQRMIVEIERNNDLTQRLQDNRNDELSSMGRALNSMFERFHGSLVQLHNISDQVSDSAQQLADNATQSRNQMEHQRHEVLTVATAMEQMVGAVEEVARTTTDTAHLTSETEQHAVASQTVLDGTLTKINNVATEVSSSANIIQELEQQSKEINDILNVISGIAEQTNLLALNAAIEAARAGEQGRGFAVVADEVRELAHSTQQSTERIEGMIKTLQASAKQAVQTMGRSNVEAERSVEHSTMASESLSEITRLMTNINQMSSQIAAAAEEQNATTSEINRSMGNINDLAQQTAEGTRASESASNSLRQLADQMSTMVNVFRLS